MGSHCANHPCSAFSSPLGQLDAKESFSDIGHNASLQISSTPWCHSTQYFLKRIPEWLKTFFEEKLWEHFDMMSPARRELPLGRALQLVYIFPLLIFFHSFYQPSPLPASVIHFTIHMSGDVTNSPESHCCSDPCMLCPVTFPWWLKLTVLDQVSCLEQESP